MIARTVDFPFKITPLQERDIPAIMEIERASFSLPWTVAIYRYELNENPFATYLGIRTLDESLPPLAGYGGLWFYIPEAHISTIAVHPLLRGLHLGAWLLAAMLVEAARQEAEEATLEVRVSNHIAQRLYLSFGFRIAGRRYRYYSDNQEDAYIMTLRPLDYAELLRRLRREEALARQRWAERGSQVLTRLTAETSRTSGQAAG